MPYVSARRRLGLGAARPLVSSKNDIRVDSFACNPYNPLSFLAYNTPLCIPTEEDLTAWQAQQLRTTQMTPENQAAAVELGNQYIALDRAAHPDEYCASDALVQSPWLSQAFGAETVCSLGGPGGGVLQALIVAGVVFIAWAGLSMVRR